VYGSCTYICHRKLDSDIKEDVLQRIQDMFDVERAESIELLNILMECMEHRELVSSVAWPYFRSLWNT